MNKDEKREAKLREKDRKEREKQEKLRRKEIIKDEKERKRNSFGYKLKTFFFTLIFAIILIIIAFFALKYYLNEKQKELYNEEMSYYLDEGKNLLNNKEFEDAMKMFERVEEESSLYEEAQELIKETMDKYLEEYNKIAEIYISEGDYERAIELYESLPEEMRNSNEVKESIADVEVARLQNAIKDVTDSHEVLSIISDELNKDLSEGARNKINEFLDEKIDAYNEEVKKNVDSENYDKYSKDIQELIKIYPENKILSDLLIYVNSFKPQSLLSLNYELENKILEISNDKSNDSVEDNKNKKYSNYILVNESDSLNENEVTWNLNGQYSELSGKICLSNKINNITSKGIKVTIYGDNKVLYKSKRVRGDTDPFSFNIDISNVKTLKIVLESDKGISYFIAEPMISK